MKSKDSSPEPQPKKLKKTNEIPPPVEETSKFTVNLQQCSTNWKKISKNVAKVNEVTNPKKKYLGKKKFIEPNKENIEKKNEIWFDVDHIYIQNELEQNKTKIQATNGDSSAIETNNEPVNTTAKLTKAIAIDCEMVGVGDDGRDSILARISLVNQSNECVYDKFVMPTEKVTDYRTHVSGIRPEDLKKSNGAEKFEVVQKEVSEILKDRVLVGHAVHNDLKILYLDHPKKKLRDTQRCKLFRKLKPSLGGLPSLKNLAQLLLGVSIQEGEHSSVIDAQATMRIYLMYRKQWELEIRNKKYHDKEEKIDDLVLKQSLFTRGNETHKRYIENKLKRRKPLHFKRK
jgi:DNA polymerase III epsilon subunit-like protein